MLEGRTLWSAIRQRREAEERVHAMQNRIKKLAEDQGKLNRSLVLVASKSQKMLDIRRDHVEVISHITRAQ